MPPVVEVADTNNDYKSQADSYKELFPHLHTVDGYEGIAPAPGPDPKNRSPAHIAAWAEASKNDDDAAIREGAKKRFRAGMTVHDE